MSFSDLFGPKKQEEKKPEEVKPPVVVTPPTEVIPPVEDKSKIQTSEPQKEIEKELEKKEVPVAAPTTVGSLFGVTPSETKTEVKQVAQQPSLFGGSSDTLSKPASPQMPTKFDITSEQPLLGKTFTIFGGKGESKTTLALSFPGKILAISFDRKTVLTWIEMFNMDPRIEVKDGLRYMDYSSSENVLKSSDITFRYITEIMDSYEKKPFEEKPDWIFIDGLEEFTTISEYVMRYRNGFRMTQGVEWQFWKDRRLFLKQLFISCLGLAKSGIIFGTKYKFEETKKNNIVTDTKKIPTWVDIVEDQTDVVVRTEMEEVKDKNGGNFNRYWATITSSKFRMFPTGAKIDITVADKQYPDLYNRLIRKEVKQ